MKLSKRLFLSTLLFSIFSATAAANDKSTIEDDTIFNIDGYHLVAERAVLGHWLGEPLMKSVESYGINKVDTAIVFAQRTDLVKLTQQITDSTFDTNSDVQAIHIYGEGFNNGVVDKVTGFVFGRANTDLVAMTVGKTHYEEKPVSESKFSSYLLNKSIGLAKQRSQGSPFSKTQKPTNSDSIGAGTVEPQMLPREYCGSSSSCDRGDDSCNVLDRGTCND